MAGQFTLSTYSCDLGPIATATSIPIADRFPTGLAGFSCWLIIGAILAGLIIPVLPLFSKSRVLVHRKINDDYTRPIGASRYIISIDQNLPGCVPVPARRERGARSARRGSSPKAGVEHDATEIWRQRRLATAMTAEVIPRSAGSACNQRETTVVWDGTVRPSTTPSSGRTPFTQKSLSSRARALAVPRV